MKTLICNIINKKSVLATALATSVLSVSAQADTVLGIYADANLWMYDTDSTISRNIIDEEINYGYNNGLNVSVAIEHILPVIPNFRVRHGALDAEKELAVTTFTVGSVVFSDEIDSTISLKHTDLLAYYEILDNVVSVDVGLGAKLINTDVSVKNTLLSIDDDLEQIVPMLYVSAGGSLPFTGFSAKADLAGIKYKDNGVVDAQAEVKYNFIDMPVFDLGGKVGYRYLDLQTDKLYKSDVNATFKGPYFGIEAHF